MGAYLTKPNREKISEDSDSYRFSVGASSMQGWRLSQEDAHNAILSYDTGCSLFAVYDGHGGHEVAAYTALRLPEFIKSSDEFKNGNYEKALEECFIRFDETLTQADVIAVLKKLMNKDEELEDADPNEVDHLYQEATMPIEDVIARFKEGEVPSNKNLERVEAAECSSKRKPLSPFLTAKRISGNGLNKHIRFGENGNHNDEEKKEDVEEENAQEKNGDAHENGEEKADSNNVNGDQKEAVKEEDMTNGSEATPAAPVPKGKGKGKGKGKSNQIAASKPKAEGEVNTTEATNDESSTETTELKKKPKKSAEELYQNMLADGNDEGSSDEDDDDAFPNNAQESSDDDDEELDADNDIDEEEDSEPDTEDDEEEEGEMMDPCYVKEEPGNDSGCTAVVALIVKDELFVANAGDSRCVVCRNGEAIEMSMDHKPEDEPEKERIEKAGGKVTADGRVGGGLNLSRAIGDHAYKLNTSLPLIEQMISPQPDIRTLKIDPKTDSFIILACDGIWNSMSSQEVVDYVKLRIEKNPDKISSICEELFDACLAPDTSGDGTGCDNMTAVIIKVKDSYNSLNEASSCKRSPSESSESLQACKRHKSDADASEPSSSTSEIKDTTTPKVEELAASSSSS